MLLDEAERSHLFDLARSANNTASRRKRRPTPTRIRPGVQRLLDVMHDAPALVRNARLDVVAANRLGRALFAPAFAERPPRRTSPGSRSSTSRQPSSSPTGTTSPTPPLLCSVEAGRSPGDHDLSDLVGQLATRSDEFRVRWAGHNVRLHDHGDKRFHHPVVGDLTLAFEELPLPADPGLTITAYIAETGTASHDALALLASWSAPAHQPAERSTAPITVVDDEQPRA